MSANPIDDLITERDVLLANLATSTYATATTGESSARWDQGLSPVAVQPLARLLNKTAAGKQALVQSDLDLLYDVLGSREDTLRRSPFGWMDAAFPVHSNGSMVECVWSRQFMDRPFFDDELDRLADMAGVSRAEVDRAVAKVHFLSGEQQELMLGQARLLRDTLEQAEQGSENASEVTDQLLQSERIRSLGTLSSGIAHHFNNLLSIILGYSSFVLNSEDLSEEVTGALSKISGAAQKGRRLTEEILAFAGSEVEQATTCHLHGMLTNILSLLQSQRSSSVKIETDFAASQDTIVAPASAVHQLVYNLLTNAFDSIPAGGIVHVATSNQKDSDGEQQVCLSIKDSSGAVHEGHADDLKLVRAEGIVGDLHGTVSVTTEPDGIMRVDVTLPCQSPKKPGTEVSPPRTHLKPATVWVVDDDLIFREMCHQTLSSEGHQIEEMETGPELQQRWSSETQRPDLLIVDFSMPDYNGLELCEWLQDNGSTTPIILVSGFAPNHPDIHQALLTKKTYFLQKPFSYREILDTVVIALGESLISAASD